MNDITEKSKPTVFYKASNKSSTPVRNKPYKKKDKSVLQGKMSRKTTEQDNSSERIEIFKPKRIESNQTKRVENKIDKPSVFQSPWNKKTSTLVTNEKLDNTSIEHFKSEHFSANQRNAEMLVYNENTCQSLFKHRREAIIKAFMTKEMAVKFKSLIEWLVNQRLGYDIVELDHITRITQTPHHGGICLIVKKRQASSIVDYLRDTRNKKTDYILAPDGVNNPHNLGGLIRTAVFYGVKGLLLKDVHLLDSGEAMRIAEGGTESLTPIKSDDFIRSLDLCKLEGYQIIILVPYKIKSVNSVDIANIKLSDKVVFVIFQAINLKLLDLADSVIHIEGNENMAALNVAVATGILLSKI